MPKYRFAHVHIISRNPEKTAQFYEKVMGAKKIGVRKVMDGSTNVDLVLNGTEIKIREPRAKALLPASASTDAGLEHFGVFTDNIEASVADLKANGITPLQEIRQTPDNKVTFFIAPENVLIELMEPKK